MTAGQAPGGGEEPEAEFARLPSAGGPVEGQELGPGKELAGQSGDLAPDLVLIEAVQREAAQAGVPGAADPVLAPGPAAVAQFQVSELAAAGAGRKAGDPVPVDVGKAQLRAWVGRSFLAMTRMPGGQPDRSSRPVRSATHAPSRGMPSLS